MTALALLGLAARLVPGAFDLSNALGAGARMRYPLGYWNANGFAFAIAAASMLWMSRRAAWQPLRWIAAASMPAILLALYFTFSRGGLLALAVSCGCLLALSHDRLWYLAGLAIGALGALPAVLAVQARDSLSKNLDVPATAAQGETVLFVLLGGIVLALALFWALRRLEESRSGWIAKALSGSRNPRVLKGIGLVLALAVVAAAIAVGGRAWDQFSSSELQFPANPQEQFSNLSGAGRYDFWQVALDAFDEEPVLGHGAGTYEFSWERMRSIPLPVHNAHSLYLETLSDLGLVGGIMLLAMVLGLLWIGLGAWRAAGGGARETNALLLAAMLAFAIGAGIDWFWEIPLIGAIFFLAAGALAASRCAQLAAPRAAADSQDERRFGVAVAGLALAWIAALALIGPLLVDRQLSSARDAAEARDFGAAMDDAEAARAIEPWAASPYVELGLIAQAQGEYERASELMTKAIDREDRNWQLYYLRARVAYEAGDTAAVDADLARARRLNPLAPQLTESSQ